MDNLLEIAYEENCPICFNNESKISLTTVSAEVIKNCGTYLDTSIVITSFQNETPMSCCSYCYESSHQLTSLEDQVKTLQKKILELGLLFSKNVMERRSRFTKEKKEYANKSNLSIDNCFTEEVEWSKESPSDSPGRLEDSFFDMWSKAEEDESITEEFKCENEMDLGDVSDVKFSNREETPNVLKTPNKEIAANQLISAVNANGHQPAVTTSMTDLLKCLKMPIIQLERLETYISKNSPKIVFGNSSSNIKPEIVEDDHFCDGTPSTKNNLNLNEEYVGAAKCIPESTGLTSDQKDEPGYNAIINKPIIVGAEMIKCEDDSSGNSDKPHKCSICRQGFLKILDLKNHYELHNKDPTYFCSFCDKSFMKMSLLKSHENYHTKGSNLNCSFCTKSFPTSCELRKHVKVHSAERPYKCSICSTWFKRIFDMQRHEKVHSGYKPHQCSFCEKSFNRSTHLKKHERTHTGEKPFKCSFCEKSFTNSYNMSLHEKIHTGERPHKCSTSTCEKSFTSAWLLNAHKQLHDEEKSNKCSFCKKSFRNLVLLRQHEIIHSDEKPYKCSFCEKSFRHLNAAKRHEKIHTGELHYKCSSCKMSFKLKHELVNHQTQHRQRLEESPEEFILS